MVLSSSVVRTYSGTFVSNNLFLTERWKIESISPNRTALALFQIYFIGGNLLMYRKYEAQYVFPVSKFCLASASDLPERM